MDIFAKNRFLVRIVILLVILNLFSVGFLWWGKINSFSDLKDRGPRQNTEAAANLKRKLQLTDEQDQQLRKIRKDFSAKEQVLGKLIRAQRDSINFVMFTEVGDLSVVQNIARRMADNEYQMELYRIEQADGLKKICTKEQLQKFQEIVSTIREYFQPEKKGERSAEKNPEKNRKQDAR